jgi:hypothetical protein
MAAAAAAAAAEEELAVKEAADMEAKGNKFS